MVACDKERWRHGLKMPLIFECPGLRIIGCYSISQLVQQILHFQTIFPTPPFQKAKVHLICTTEKDLFHKILESAELPVSAELFVGRRIF